MSIAAGTPAQDEYPAIALGSSVLLHLLRAGLLLGVTGAIALIGWRATAGEFPIRFANVEYSAKRTAVETKRTDATLARRLLVLEVLAGVRSSEALDADESEA